MTTFDKTTLTVLSLVATSWLTASPAHADASDVEVGAFAGVHIFADDNELGVWDAPDADSLKNSIAFGVRLAYAFTSLISVEGEGLIMPTESRNTGEGSMAFGYRLHGLLHLVGDSHKLRPFVVLGFGGMSSTKSDNSAIHADSDAMFHGGVGLKYAVGDRWGVRADGRVLLPPSSEDHGATVDYELLVGGYFTLGSKHKAAPAPARDSDGDGILDDQDKCPNEAEDADNFQDEDGCPDPDNDGDGIADADDKCPDQAETVNDIDDQDGCPETDEDGDGLIGSQDKCPNEAEDKDNFQDEDGCPDPDNDGDGVADADDKCPNQAETENGYQDADGCPDEVPVAVAKFTGTIKGITFKTGSDVITKGSYKTLNAAAKVLTDYPELRLEIQGHTDNVGDDDKNLDLSQRRAESVKNYLVKKGIDEGRLEAKGYGETTPIADNGTAEGRAQNRRVEFKLVK